jgi:hypothetical protein
MTEMESDDHCQKEQVLQRENLKLSSENVELKFQLEQANKDLPRLKVNYLMIFMIVRKSNAYKALPARHLVVMYAYISL